MLECGAVMPDQFFQSFRSVPPPARPEDQVVRAGERVHAVDLDETEVVEHAIEIPAPSRARCRSQQQVPVQKQAAGALVVDEGACHSAKVSPITHQCFNVVSAVLVREASVTRCFGG
jgi:hypothetical protein